MEPGSSAKPNKPAPAAAHETCYLVIFGGHHHLHPRFSETQLSLQEVVSVFAFPDLRKIIIDASLYLRPVLMSTPA
jgi:hypothetical protein